MRTEAELLEGVVVEAIYLERLHIVKAEQQLL